MKSIRDFEDILELLEKHAARYLIVGGLAVIYHAKPRYTKDMDLFVDPADGNIELVNQALDEFGSPHRLASDDPEQILLIGVVPNRIDVLVRIDGITFEEAWESRIRDNYGDVAANWIGLDGLISSKQCLEGPRHSEDVRVLQEVKELRREHE